jgi:hypothetical protein
MFNLQCPKLLLNLHHPKLLLRCRNAHWRYKNATSRPFQKRTRLLDHDVQKSRMRMFLLLKALHEAAHLKYRNSWDEQDETILINILLSNLEKFLQGLTSPLRK